MFGPNVDPPLHTLPLWGSLVLSLVCVAVAPGQGYAQLLPGPEAARPEATERATSEQAPLSEAPTDTEIGEVPVSTPVADEGEPNTFATDEVAESSVGEEGSLGDAGLSAETSDAATTAIGEAPAPEVVGTRVSPAEYEPRPPPTAQQVEAAQSRDAIVQQLAEELKYYEAGVESFVSGQKALIRDRYEQERTRLSSRYEKRIESLETEERTRRREAIRRFETFLQKYPDNDAYTPDAMFRLAELHFEKSSDDFLQESRAYEDQLLNGTESAGQIPPEPSYEKTIGLHRALLERFPKYRLADAAYYLLGYAYGEMGEMDQALVAFESLVNRHPTSKFVPEVWTRIGEIYFDGNTPDSLSKAVLAYQQVLDDPENSYYDKALYKLAWTYYRLDRYDESVDSFIDLVKYADDQKKKTGVSGSELRSEAIQYIAISLADESWGSFDKAKSKLTSVEKASFTQDIWKRYGEVLFDQTRYQEAIVALRFMTERYPGAPGNPEAQAQIVQAHEQLRDFDSATLAREKLVEQYGEGSSWAQLNAEDTEALAKATSLTERSLYTAALFRHQQAQSLRAQGDERGSRSQYQAAATAYEKYLNRFPDSNRSYDFNFYLAETLYYSESYDRAARQYSAVRDSKINNKHLDASALYAVISHEKRIERLEQSGQLPRLKVLKAEERKGRPVKPKALPDERRALVDAADRYTHLVDDGENLPAVAYRAAQEFYKHDQFDEARSRFEQIIAEYPDHTVSEFSANLIIESYLASQQWDKVDEWSGRIIDIAQRSQESGTRGKKLVSALADVRQRAQFKIAEQLNADEQYEDAAIAYVKLVDADPKSDVADKALFNAAVAYEQANRFDTASKIYRRIFDDYPGSELAARSLFRVGISAEKGFDFPVAIDAYQTLVRRYPKADERADASFNVAVVLEHMQRYGEAANAYRRYATVFKRRADSGDVYFRSALVYEKMGRWDRMVATLKEFVRRYKSAPQQRERIVRAYLKLGEAETKRGRVRLSRKSYNQCVSEFKRLRLGVESRAGGYAAECAFELAEFVFRSYDRIAIVGSERKQVNALKRKAKIQVEVQKAYSDVFQYKRLEQTVAASYRIGHSYDRFAEALFTAPVPNSLNRDPDLADAYRAQLEDQAAVLERNAEGAYRKAYEEARRGGITNKWTRRILEGLHKFAPNEFPIQKQGKPALQKEFMSGNGLAPMVRRSHSMTEEPPLVSLW